MKKRPDKNNQHEKIDSVDSVISKEVTPTPARHQKFVIQSPKYGAPLMIGCLVLFIGIFLSIMLTSYWASDWDIFTLIGLATGVQIILIIVTSIVEGYRLVIDEKGIHFFTGDLLRESIRWNQIKRIKTGWFNSLTIWKDSEAIWFGPIFFSRSDLKRAYEVILSRLAKSRVRKSPGAAGVRSGNSR
jgi:hypothetical protein